MVIISTFVPPESLSRDLWWLYEAQAQLWQAEAAAVNSADLGETPDQIYAEGLDPDHMKIAYLVASETPQPTTSGDVLGIAKVDLSISDNPKLAVFSLVVRESARGRGVGAVLEQAVRDFLASQGRSHLISYYFAALANSGAELSQLDLPARSGTGTVRADSASAKFLLRRGYEPYQIERISLARLPDQTERLRIFNAARTASSLDYETLTWAGPTPEELLADAARLRSVMSTDVPLADLDLEAEYWDQQRVQKADQDITVADRQQLQTFVRHRPSGEMVGFTRIFVDNTKQDIGHQWETLVVSAHRGHRLGMLIKAANHAALCEYWPNLNRLLTGNAEENDHMLAINEALGYRPYGQIAMWDTRSEVE